MGLFPPSSSQPSWSCRFEVAAREAVASQPAKQQPLRWRAEKPQTLGSGQMA